MNELTRILTIFRMAVAFWRCGPVNAVRMALKTRELIREEIDLETVRLKDQ
jgi:hypothetical protein